MKRYIFNVKNINKKLASITKAVIKYHNSPPHPKKKFVDSSEARNKQTNFQRLKTRPEPNKNIFPMRNSLRNMTGKRQSNFRQPETRPEPVPKTEMKENLGKF